MRKRNTIISGIDPWLIVLYLLLVLIGWANIYASVYTEEHQSILDLSQNYGRQMIWILSSLLIALVIIFIDAKFFIAFSLPIYLIICISLVAVLFLGKVVAGSKSWFQLGPFAFQPSEFAKFATALLLARFMSILDFDIKKFRNQLIIMLIIFFPAGLIFLQNDTGSALVYLSFFLVLFREGMSSRVLLLGFAVIVLGIVALLVDKYILIGVFAGLCVLSMFLIKRKFKNIMLVLGFLIAAASFVFVVDYAFENVLEAHQRTRINVLLGKEIDLYGAGYNVNQSKIAIGSGGLFGKGFLNGTQTKFDFVPEQSTDFIFCTVGEEWGFMGSLATIFLYMMLLIRLIRLSERQKSTFTRIYGYGVASVLFFHFAVNIGMTIGLLPVIGIPLPFFSYGGSSLWAFTILLFVFIKLDSDRINLL